MRKGMLRNTALALLTVSLALSGASVSAQGIGVAPVRLELKPGERATVFTLTNTADHPVELQTRALRWSQQDGADQHQPTADVIVSPTRFTLAAGAKQVVRVYPIARNARLEEGAYRVFVDQLPERSSAESGAIQLPLRLMLPLFVAGSDNTPAALEWRARRDGDAIVLAIRNQGRSHVRLNSIAAHAGTLAPPAARPVLFYLLPGAERELRLPRSSAMGSDLRSLVVRAETDRGPIDAHVELSNAP